MSTSDPKRQKLAELLRGLLVPGAPLPPPTWVCSGCGAKIYYQDNPGRGCPQCKRPRPS